jgi:hypothetical protein
MTTAPLRPRFGPIVAAWLVRAYDCKCHFDPETCAARRGGAEGERCGCACHKSEAFPSQRA